MSIETNRTGSGDYFSDTDHSWQNRTPIIGGDSSPIDGSRIQVKADLSEAIAAELAVRIRSRALDVPKILNERRIKYGIPNGVFDCEPLDDKVFVYQIPFSESDTYGDTSIIMSEHGARREKEAASRGVLCSAGLKALDYLKSHGTEIGDIVKFMKLLPWRLPVECIKGTWLYVMVMDAGSVVGNEDLARRRHNKEVQIQDAGIGVYDHRYFNGTMAKQKISLEGSEV